MDNIIEDSLAHIEFLIDEKLRDKHGITDRTLDTQVLRLCSAYNDLQADNQRLREALEKMKECEYDTECEAGGLRVTIYFVPEYLIEQALEREE